MPSPKGYAENEMPIASSKISLDNNEVTKCTNSTNNYLYTIICVVDQ